MGDKNSMVQQAAEYLNGIPRFSREKHPLDALKKMTELLGASPADKKIIHVAGSNGKGSVCAFLNAVLRTSGYHTAVFTSPHLVSITERFCFDGEPVSSDLFLEAYQAVIEAVPEFEQAGLGHPTYFEYLFLMFLWMLKKEPAEYVILETGLGGRLDATNSIERPLLTIITSISLDHMEYLGNTVTAIAGEKAGIIKTGIPVIYDTTSKEAAAVIEKRAKEQGCRAIGAGRDSYTDLHMKDGMLFLKAKTLTEEEAALSESKTESCGLTVPFAAEYQAVNAMLAFRAAEYLKLPYSLIIEGIRSTVWQGRMEQIGEGVYIDGAHNEGGIRAFAAAAASIAAERERRTGAAGRKILVFAVVSDKEYRDMAGILCREFQPDLLILTQIQYGRGLDLSLLEQAAREEWNRWREDEKAAVPASEWKERKELRVVPTVKDALAAAIHDRKPEDTVFCAGSLYLIGEIKSILGTKNEI